MSQQQFSPREREAFWKTYGKRCFYHGGELLLGEMEIDHVVPEELLNAAAEVRQQTFMAHGLPLDYTIVTYENLVAACGECNGKKGSLMLPVGQLAITLARARENAPKIRQIIKRRKNSASKERLLISIEDALAAGHLSGHDIVEHLKRNGLLGLMTSGVVLPSTVKPSTIVFATSRAQRDLDVLGMKLTVEEIVRIIDSRETQVLRQRIEDGRLITEIRNGEMYFKYEVRDDVILIISAHLT